jgi:hypothetical protein
MAKENFKELYLKRDIKAKSLAYTYMGHAYTNGDIFYPHPIWI